MVECVVKRQNYLSFLKIASKPRQHCFHDIWSHPGFWVGKRKCLLLGRVLYKIFLKLLGEFLVQMTTVGTFQHAEVLNQWSASQLMRISHNPFKTGRCSKSVVILWTLLLLEALFNGVICRHYDTSYTNR